MKFATLSLLFLSTSSSLAQLTYFDEPQLLWSKQIRAAGDMNGAFVHKSEDVVYAVDGTGVVFALPAGVATEAPAYKWIYIPQSLPSGALISCDSGVTFCYDGDPGLPDYVVYSVVDTPNNGPVTSRLIVVDKESGMGIYETISFPGKARTPKTTSDCRHVVVTSNQFNSTSGATDGHFFMFDLLSQPSPVPAIFKDGPSFSIPYSDLG